VPILLEKLEAEPSLIGFRDIAALGTRGRTAGSKIVKYLGDKDWDLRLGAIRTLGYIGYEPAAEELTKQLSCAEDWRAVLSAAGALARLHATQSIPELLRISNDHWYPPVRNIAAIAIDIIEHYGQLESSYPAENFALEFFDYENTGDKMEFLKSEDLGRLKFSLEKPSEQPLTVGLKDLAGEITNSVRKAVTLDGGFLVATDNGEWGGETAFVDSAGNSHTVVESNTEAIHKTPDGFLAVTGLSHLSMNHGVVYRLNSPKQGQWVAIKWRALPGAPIFSRMLTTADLLVSCTGGIVLVSLDGKMKCLGRSDVLVSQSH